MDLSIKPEYQDTVIGFANSGKPLGKRSEADLLKLAEMALKNKGFQKFFVAMPTAADIQAAKAAGVVKALPNPQIAVVQGQIAAAEAKLNSANNALTSLPAGTEQTLIDEAIAEVAAAQKVVDDLTTELNALPAQV